MNRLNPCINTSSRIIPLRLIEPDLLRRDQVWLVEKNRNQASALVSLSDFSPRKNEALERAYLAGRYGSVPFLSPTLGLKP